MTSDDIWAAGLFEGEGCFHGRTAKPRLVAVKLVSTDEDVLRRFAAVMGVGTVAGPISRGRRFKPYWSWQVASFQDVQYIVCRLWGQLGARRRAKAVEMLQGYLAVPMKQHHRPKRKFKRLTPEQVQEIRHRLSIGCSNADTAFNYGVSPSLISHIKCGDRHQGSAL